MDKLLETSPSTKFNSFILTEVEVCSEFDNSNERFRSEISHLAATIRIKEGQAYARILELVPYQSPHAILNEPLNGVMQAVSQAKTEGEREYASGRTSLYHAIILIFIVVGASLVDVILLWKMFSATFSDIYGEMSVSAVLSTTVLALQGLVTFVAFKVAFSSERGMRLASLALGLMVVLYLLSLCIIAGFQGTSEITDSVANNLNWQQLPSAPSGEVPPLQWWGTFLWRGMPYMIVPVVAGILSAKATKSLARWKGTKDARNQFHEAYRDLFAIHAEVVALRAERAKKEEGWADIIKAPVQKRILQILMATREIIELVDGARSRQEKEIFIPGPGGMSITNPDYIYDKAVEAQNAYGGDFIDRVFEDWAEARGYKTHRRMKP
jgi:hypothetical protein